MKTKPFDTQNCHPIFVLTPERITAVWTIYMRNPWQWLGAN